MPSMVRIPHSSLSMPNPPNAMPILCNDWFLLLTTVNEAWERYATYVSVACLDGIFKETVIGQALVMGRGVPPGASLR